jgi:hypothetical protein
MKVYEKGTAISFTKRDFVAQGGEGSIYVLGNKAYKVYIDPSKMIPLGKIQELSALTDPSIIKPQHVLKDKKGKPIGYSMAAVPDSYALCQIFPKAFRDREHLSHQKVWELVQKLQAGVQHAHSKRILVVDLNEMNFLVEKHFKQLYFIDVDSYQTPHFKATALMESVRDHQVQNNAFTQGSDWFSFAVVSFQMFVGVHPYKGKHPSLKGLAARMGANISVFNPDVRVPRVCYPFDVIPQAYRDWYQAIFEKGDRLAPPGGPQTVVAIIPQVKTLLGSANLIVEEMSEYSSIILKVWPHEGKLVVATDKGLWIDRRRIQDRTLKVKGAGVTPQQGQAVCLSEDPTSKIPLLHNLTAGGVQIPFGLRAEAAMSYEGRIYIKNDDKVLEVLLNEMGQQVVPSTRLAAQVLPKATKLFPGVVVQDLLGNTHVAVFPRSGTTYQAHITELDKYKIVEAKYDRGVLFVVGTRKGRYDRFVFRFDQDHTNYDVRVVKDVSYVGINFTVLDSGVAVCLNEDEKLELFSSKLGSKGMKLVDDATLSSDIALSRVGSQLLFVRGTKIYKARMK